MQRVMRACGFIDTRLRATLAEVLDAETAEFFGEEAAYAARQTAEALIEAWRSYQRAGPMLRYLWGPRKFFALGMWRDDSAWPLDEERVARATQAAVGM